MNHRAAPDSGRLRNSLPCHDGQIIPRGKQSPQGAQGASLDGSSRMTMTSSRAPENPLRWGTDMALATQPWRAYWLRASSRRGRSNRSSTALAREVRSLYSRPPVGDEEASANAGAGKDPGAVSAGWAASTFKAIAVSVGKAHEEASSPSTSIPCSSTAAVGPADAAAVAPGAPPAPPRAAAAPPAALRPGAETWKLRPHFRHLIRAPIRLDGILPRSPQVGHVT